MKTTGKTERTLRSRAWFDDPANSDMTALNLERYMNFGLSERPRHGPHHRHRGVPELRSNPTAPHVSLVKSHDARIRAALFISANTSPTAVNK
ncbi:MAG: hypothetical protein ACREQZ_08205 [Woeseiaceae bacterium]